MIQRSVASAKHAMTRKRTRREKFLIVMERVVQWARSIAAIKSLYPYHVIDNLIGRKKVRYLGLAKNEAQLLSLFGLANLLIANRWLLAAQDLSAS